MFHKGYQKYPLGGFGLEFISVAITDVSCVFFFSVTNVVKRAMLIWLSVLWFGNPVTVLGALGTITVTCGVLCYNKAREYEHHLAEIAAGKSHSDVDIDEVKHV